MVSIDWRSRRDPHSTRQRDFTSSAKRELRSLGRSEVRLVSGHGAPELSVNGAGARVAIVASSWHETVMAGLLEGAKRTLTSAGVEQIDILHAPGAFELPIFAKACADDGYDAIVALGVVIRGGTPHFEYVSAAATNGLAQVALDTGVPVGFGLLTCDTEAQALDRAGLPGSAEDKGREAAEAALATLTVLRALGD